MLVKKEQPLKRDKLGRFIKGIHYNKGIKHSEETRLKNSEAKKKFFRSELGKEQAQRHSVNLKKCYADGSLVVHNKGKERPDEILNAKAMQAKYPADSAEYKEWGVKITRLTEWAKNQSVTMKKRYADGSLVVHNKGKETPEETKLVQSESRKKFLASEAGKEYLKNNPMLFQKGQIPHNKGKPMPEEAKRELSRILKKQFADGRVPSGLGKTPSEETRRKNAEGHKYMIYPKEDTKPEKFLQTLLTDKEIKFEKHKPFKTSGRPYYHKVDLFIQPNICIEVYGDYHHANPNLKNTDDSMKYPDDFVLWKEYRGLPAKTAGEIRAKDERITKEIEQQGNVILTFWQSELQDDPKKCLQKIIKAIKESSR